MAQPNPFFAVRIVLLLGGVAGLIVGLYLWWKHSAGKPRSLDFWRRLLRIKRRDATVLSLVLLSCALFMEFIPETWALAWHIRYGGTATISNGTLGTYKIPVPMLWWASQDGVPSKVDVVKFPGRFRDLYLAEGRAFVSVSLAFRLTPGADQQKEMWRVDHLLNTNTTASTLTIAGESTTCFERRDPRLQGFVIVDCVPTTQTQGLSASFLGFETSLPHFYAILTQVRKKS